MANPVIDSIIVSPDPVPTGQTATVTVVAHDPDATTVTFNVTVTDSAGNTASGQISSSVADPLTYQITANVGTVTPTGQPNVFIWSE
jgi:hypothetical protein